MFASKEFRNNTEYGGKWDRGLAKKVKRSISTKTESAQLS